MFTHPNQVGSHPGPMTLSLGCSQPRVGLLTKTPIRKSTLAPQPQPPFHPSPAPARLTPACSCPGGGAGGLRVNMTAPATPSPSSFALPGSPFGPGRPPAGLASFRLLIRGKKEHRVVGLCVPRHRWQHGPQGRG